MRAEIWWLKIYRMEIIGLSHTPSLVRILAHHYGAQQPSWLSPGPLHFSFSSWLSLDLAIFFCREIISQTICMTWHCLTICILTHKRLNLHYIAKNVFNPHNKYIIHCHMTVTCWCGMHMRNCRSHTSKANLGWVHHWITNSYLASQPLALIAHHFLNESGSNAT